MRKIVLLCLTLAFLTSCIGIDSRLTIRDNGSGTLQLIYRVSQLVTNLGVSSTGKSVIPLPISRADFERSLAQSGGKVRLTRFDRSENEKDITIRVELAFNTLDDLAKVDAFQDAQLKSATEGTSHTFSQLVAKTLTPPLNDDSKRMLDTLFDGYNITYVLEVPQPIQDSTIGTLSPDKKTLTYTARIQDVMGTTQDLVMSARW
jgi:hypothetical protein